MARESTLHGTTLLVLGAVALLVAGCASPPGTYPDPNGPRNGDGFLIDPHTGAELPGQPDPGI